MTIFLILGTALIPIIVYGFWLAGELGLGPRLRPSRRTTSAQPEAEDANHGATGVLDRQKR